MPLLDYSRRPAISKDRSTAPLSYRRSRRYEVTQKEEDRFIFKVPMLRNVTRTAPYFNDGKVAALEEAVRLMGWHQLDRHLTSREIQDIIAFLRTLEGNPPFVETRHLRPSS